MPLGTEVSLGPGDIMSDGDPARPKGEGDSRPPNFRPTSIVAKRSPISAIAELLLYKLQTTIESGSAGDTLQPFGLGLSVVGEQFDRLAAAIAETNRESVRFNSDADTAERQSSFVRQVLRNQQRQRHYIAREAQPRRNVQWSRPSVSACLSVCLSVCLSLAAFPHYCMDPDVSWGNSK